MLAVLETGGFEAVVVGGCVRDQLLGKQPCDWDVATSALPGQARRLLLSLGARLIETGIPYGTLTALIDDEQIEVTTYRVEGRYLDGRHPAKVEFVSNLNDDLGRRDFTMNAMAWHPERGLLDPCGGREDIKERRIRTVGDPGKRLGEDALRILRALRFASVLGFDLADELAFSLHGKRSLLTKVAPQRLHSELLQLLSGSHVARILLEYPDVLAVLIPEILPTLGFDQQTPYHRYDVWEHTARAVAASVPKPLVRLTLLMHDLAKPKTFSLDEGGRGHFFGHNLEGEKVARARLTALRFDQQTIETVAELIRWHQENIKPENLLRWLNRLGEERLRLLFAVKLGDMAAHADNLVDERMERIEATRQAFEALVQTGPCYQRLDLAVDGYDLMELGFAPGRTLGGALDSLLDAVIEGRLPNEKEALLIAARALREDEAI